jgi:hypothetical protein
LLASSSFFLFGNLVAVRGEEKGVLAWRGRWGW